MPIIPLNNDRVVGRLRHIGSVIENGARVRSLLGNGHIEGPLKALLGISWESSAKNGHRAFLMEKDCGERIDLVAFENGMPTFWIETKSTFLDLLHVGRKVARDAMGQAGDYLKRIDDPLQGTPAYVVHFLGSLPNLETAQLPDWAIRRFRKLGSCAVQDVLRANAKAIEDVYSQQPLYESSRRVQLFDHGPIVVAIVVKVSVERQSRLGALYSDLDKKTKTRLRKKEGVRVKEILPTSILADTLFPKDIIMSINDFGIDLRTQFYETLNMHSGRKVRICVERRGEKLSIPVIVPRA